MKQITQISDNKTPEADNERNETRETLPKDGNGPEWIRPYPAAPAQAQHSPLPFKFGWETSDRAWSIVTDKNGSIVANVNTVTGPDTTSAPATRKMPSESNAQFIVRACNNAQRLADALNKAVARLNYLHQRDGFNTKNHDAIEQGREALAEWSKK